MQRRVELLLYPKNLGLIVGLDEAKLESALSGVAAAVATEPVYPSLKLSGQAVVVEKGKPGSELDLPSLRLKIGESLSLAHSDPIAVPSKPVDPTITEEEAVVYQKRAESLLGKTLIVNFEYQSFVYKGEGLFPFLGPKGGLDTGFISEVVDKIASGTEREAENPVFVFEEGRVKEFEPSIAGVSVNRDELGPYSRET